MDGKINYVLMTSNEAKVVSINKLKSNSFRLALAVKRSRNESNGESFSLVEYAGMPVGENTRKT